MSGPGGPDFDNLSKELAKGIKPKAVRKLEDVPDADKIALFDRLYGFAIEAVDYMMENQRVYKNDEAYTWEAVMEGCLTTPETKKAFWDWWNNQY